LKRLKRRYLALKFDSDFAFAPSDREVIDTFWNAVTRLYGEVGASMANLVLIDYDAQQRLAILRCNLSLISEVRTALATVIRINDKAAAVHVLAVSGTIKALRGKLEN
jgi:RNase P/RNase MRP subunit POP5